MFNDDFYLGKDIFSEITEMVNVLFENWSESWAGVVWFCH